MRHLFWIFLVCIALVSCADNDKPTDTEQVYASGAYVIDESHFPASQVPTTMSNHFVLTYGHCTYGPGGDSWYGRLWIYDPDHTIEQAYVLNRQNYCVNYPYGCTGFIAEPMSLCRTSGDTTFWGCYKEVSNRPECFSWSCDFDVPDGQQTGWWWGTCTDEIHQTQPNVTYAEYHQEGTCGDLVCTIKTDGVHKGQQVTIRHRKPGGSWHLTEIEGADLDCETYGGSFSVRYCNNTVIVQPYVTRCDSTLWPMYWGDLDTLTICQPGGGDPPPWEQ